MDWARAIERNREALMGIVAALFALLEFEGSGLAGRIPRHIHRAVLRVLRPAESAARRLIVIAARGLVMTRAPARPMPAGPIGQGASRRPSFQLFDPCKRFARQRPRTGPRLVPRTHVFAGDPHLVPFWSTPQPIAHAAPPPDDGHVSAERLCHRLQAVKLVLDDLPRQARRLARWRARREKMSRPKFIAPLRLGPPPGHRRKPIHEVDGVLAECHGLARDAIAPDTS